MSDIGRNDPCPCNSGKKYKKCCLLKKEGARDGLFLWKRADARVIGEGVKLSEKMFMDEMAALHLLYWGKEENGVAYGSEESERMQFIEWLVHDHRQAEGGPTAMENVLKDKGLGDLERRIAEARTQATMSVYQVTGIFPEEGLELEDIFSRKKVIVKDKLASRSVQKGVLIPCRIFPAGEHNFVSGAVFAISPAERHVVDEYLEGGYRNFKKKVDKKTSFGDFLRRKAHLFGGLRVAVERFREENLFPRALVNHDGEKLEPSKAVYRVVDAGKVADELRELKEMDEMEKGERFIWNNAKSNLLLGNIELKEGTLSLECNSKERLARGKKLLKGISGLKHKVGVLESMKSLLESVKAGVIAGKRKDEEKNDPPELAAVKKRLLLEHKQEYYEEKWLKNEVLALDGMMPLLAAKDPKMRRRLIDLLRQLEFMEGGDSDPEGPRYDFNCLRVKLGLKEE